LESVRVKLKVIDDSLKQWNEDKASGDKYYKLINSSLNNALKDESFPQHLKLKLKELFWHINSMLGIDDGNGHDFEQHLAWAYGVLIAVRSL
jgi:hypothetical protein